MKKLLAAVLIAFGLPILAYAQSVQPVLFEDDYSPYLEAAYWMAENEVLSESEYKDNNFKLSTCVNRAHFLTWLYEVQEKDPSMAEDAPFSNLSQTDPHAPYANLAFQEAVLEGSNGMHMPEACVTRAEAIKMTVQSFFNGELPEIPFWPYTRASEVADLDMNAWYGPSMEVAFSYNALGTAHSQYVEPEDELSFPSFNYFPNESMPRGEVLELLYRMKTVMDNQLNYYSYWDEPYPLKKALFTNDASCDFDHSRVRTSLDVFSAPHQESDFKMQLNLTDPMAMEKLTHFTETFFGVSDLSSWIQSMQPRLGLEIGSSTKGSFALVLDEENPYNTPQALMALRVEDGDSFSESAALWLQKDTGKDQIHCETEGNGVYWVSDEFTAYRSANIFVIGAGKAEVSSALLRMRNRSNQDALSDGSHINIQADASAFETFVTDGLAGDPSLEMFLGEWNRFGDMSMNLEFRETGLFLESEIEMTDSSDPYLTQLRNKELSLIEHMPADGVVFYAEVPDLMLSLEPLLCECDLKDAADMFNVDLTELKQWLSSPVAIGLSNNGENMPGLIAMIGSGSKNNVTRSMVSTLSTFLRDMGYEITRDKQLYTVSVDMDSPKGVGLRLMLGSSFLPETGTIELSYGVNSDGIFVLALYPNYAETYSQRSLLHDAKFRSAMDELDLNDAYSVAYMDMSELTEYLEMITDLLGARPIDSEFAEQQNTSAMEVLRLIHFFVAGSSVEGQSMIQKMFLAY